LFFERLRRGAGHSLTLLGGLASATKRPLLRRMIRFSRDLPGQFEHPLPAMMAALTPEPQPQRTISPDEIRHLADAVAAWHLRSPLGICLRRSLLRYYFLREANLPLQITFGARFKAPAAGGDIGGHAWLLLAGEPYYENPDDYTRFVRMYTYPTVNSRAIASKNLKKEGQCAKSGQPI